MTLPPPQLQQQSEIAKLSDVFLKTIDIKNRRFRGHTYRNVFVGSETVDAMVAAGNAVSRTEAVAIVRRLEKDLRLFSHVAGHHLFKDDYLFYRLTDSESLDLWWTTYQNGESVDHDALVEKARIFRNLANIKDRKYHFKTYKKCFVGSDMVDSMVYAGLVQTRQEAVSLGRAIQHRLKWFRHVTGQHSFKDDKLFYRFNVSADLPLTQSHDSHSLCLTTSSNIGKNELMKQIQERLNEKYPESTVLGMQRVIQELKERLKNVYTGDHVIVESGIVSRVSLQKRQSSSLSLWTDIPFDDDLSKIKDFADDDSSASYTEYTILEEELDASDDESLYTEETIVGDDFLDGPPFSKDLPFPHVDVSALTHSSM